MERTPTTTKPSSWYLSRYSHAGSLAHLNYLCPQIRISASRFSIRIRRRLTEQVADRTPSLCNDMKPQKLWSKRKEDGMRKTCPASLPRPPHQTQIRAHQKNTTTSPLLFLLNLNPLQSSFCSSSLLPSYSAPIPAPSRCQRFNALLMLHPLSLSGPLVT